MRRVGLFGTLLAVALAFATPSQSEIINFERLSTEYTMFNPCGNGGAGEEVLVTGRFQILSAVMSNDNRTVIQIARIETGSGIGLTTGDRYRLINQAVVDPIAWSSHNDQLTAISVFNFRMVGAGPGNDGFFHGVRHSTLNANGDVTSVVFAENTGCR